MGPKRTATIVLAVIAAMVVLISMIAGAIAVFPREHRYAVGAQTSYAPPPITSERSKRYCSAQHSDDSANACQARLALARSWLRPRSASLPNKTAVAQQDPHSQGQGDDRLLLGIGGRGGQQGKSCSPTTPPSGYIPASTMKLLTSTAALSILGPGHTFKDVGGQSEAGSDHSGRRRRSVPLQQVARRLSEAGDDHWAGPGYGKSPEARQDQKRQCWATTPRCSAVRRGTPVGRVSTLIRSRIPRRSGLTKVMWVTVARYKRSGQAGRHGLRRSPRPRQGIRVTATRSAHAPKSAAVVARGLVDATGADRGAPAHGE